MITLSELRSMVETAPLTREKKAPGWRQLRENGGEIVAKADFTGDYILEVFESGYVYYRTGRRYTTFSLQDTTLNFDIELQDEYYKTIKYREVLKSSVYDTMPWFVRVMFEGEIRINVNRCKEEEENTDYDSIADDYGLFGFVTDSPLVICLRKESDEMWCKSLRMTTERQQQAIIECLLNDVPTIVLAKELGISHQAVSDAIKRGRRKLRENYDKIYGDYE